MEQETQTPHKRRARYKGNTPLECLHGEGHMYATDVDQEESA